MFAEFPSLTNESITRFMTVAEGLNQIPDRLTRTDALGMMQANVGLWNTCPGKVKFGCPAE